MLKNSRSVTKMNNMKVDNKIAMDSLDVTNEFSDFFSNIGSNYANKFDN